MRPIVEVPEEHRATAIEKFGKDDAWGSGDILSDRHTDTETHRDTQTDALITILLSLIHI